MGAGENSAQSHGADSADRSNGNAHRQFAGDEEQRRVVARRFKVITSSAQLAAILPALEPLDRVAVDTEADSLHCYFEKLCLLQLSFGGKDFLVDPLAGFDLAPLAEILRDKELILQGADFDLRLLKRSLNFTATRVFDTVIAARLLGIR